MCRIGMLPVILYFMVAKVKHPKRQRGLTRVSSKNQVTLPVAALAKARIKPGDRLQVEASADGRITLSRAYDPIDKFAGAVPGLSRAYLEKLRDEWDR